MRQLQFEKYLILLNFSSKEVSVEVADRFIVDGLKVLVGNRGFQLG